MRRGFIIGLLLAILVGAGFYFLLLSPVFENIADLEAQLDQATQEEALLLQERNRLRRIQEAELQYLDALGEIERMIPTTPQQADLLNELEALAVENNVKWSGASFAEPSGGEGGNGLNSMGVSLQLEGQYFEVLAYLYAVQDLERILRVDSASFTPAPDEDGLIKLSTSVSLVTFTTGEVGLPIAEEEEATDGGA